MNHIKIIDVPDLEISQTKIAEQLRDFLRSIRKNKITLGQDDKQALLSDADPEDPDGLNELEISRWEEGRISKRAEKLSKARAVAAGLTHLKPDERERLQPSLNGMKIVLVESTDWADTIAAMLHEEMPWMAPATEYVWNSLRRSAQRREPATLRPLILNGPPGIGKSVWARFVADALSVPHVDVDASKGGAGMALVGLESGWGSALAGRPIDLMLSRRIANPLVIVDEICKAQSATSTRGGNYSFSDSLLSLLEPATAVKWECPYFRVKFDMSHISWILTSNVIKNVTEPVRSRCQVIELPDVTIEQLQNFAQNKGAATGLSDCSVEAVVEAIVRAPMATGRRQSLRDVVRMLERAEVLEGRPPLQ